MLSRIDVVEPPCRAVINAGEHDQRRHGLQRIGRRQQHGDGRDRPMPGSADQRADQRADQA
jgi:hypothetical protein